MPLAANRSGPAKSEIAAHAFSEDFESSAVVWRSDGGEAEIHFRISRIAKRLGDPSLQDDLTRLALNDEKGGR